MEVSVAVKQLVVAVKQVVNQFSGSEAAGSGNMAMTLLVVAVWP